MAQEFGIADVTTDFASLCSRNDIDIIDICTPPFLHYGQIMRALGCEKHVICEKPLVGSLKQVDEVAVAEQRSGRRVMPIFQYRFGHGLQKLKCLVDQGLAGKVYLTTVEVSWRRRPEYYNSPWRGKMETELGGVLLGVAIHFVDAMLHITGPARKVFARAATRVNRVEVEDCLVASLEMADGSLASISTTLGASQEITRHRFHFGNFTAESNSNLYNTKDPWTFTGDSPELANKIDETLASFKPQPEDYVGQFSRFHRALNEGGELPVTLREARESLELISAIYYSAANGEQVSLPIEPAHPVYSGWRFQGRFGITGNTIPR
jgi:predicted dehydrogenase